MLAVAKNFLHTGNDKNWNGILSHGATYFDETPLTDMSSFKVNFNIALERAVGLLDSVVDELDPLVVADTKASQRAMNNFSFVDDEES